MCIGIWVRCLYRRLHPLVLPAFAYPALFYLPHNAGSNAESDSLTFYKRNAMNPRTLFEKLWRRHAVLDTDDGQTLLYINLQLINEVTSPQAFDALRINGLSP